MTASTSTSTRKGIRVERAFTAQCRSAEGYVDPLDRIEWKSFDTKIVNKDGSIVFEMTGIEAPVTWSPHAVDIAASKYFRKAGVGSPEGRETSVRQLVTRVARAVRLAGERQEYFASPEDAQAFEDEVKCLLITQRMAFNSPVWFNVGLREAYGISGAPAGNWFWNPDTNRVELTPDSYTYPQASACFIIAIQDDLMDIAKHVEREMRIFKYGSGAGSNYSNLRALDEPLSNGGTSSGMMSYLEVYDKAAGAIKSGGTTRRAAKMVVVDVEHPDCDRFIDWKVREEDKFKALVAAGYSSDFNGEAYRTISGQNANNSIRVSDVFMRAALEGGEYETFYRVSKKVAAKKKAKDTLRKIADAAWRCADPGMQFDDNINNWHTCLDTTRQRATNPCSEFCYIDDTACNLLSLNLVLFDRPGSGFDVAAFRHATRVAFMAQEILVDYASYPTEAIARNSHAHRPLGLGFANLGALLMRRGIAYDSNQGRGIAASITSLMCGVAYETSADMAAVKGPFAAYPANERSMLRVMEGHRLAHVRLAPDMPEVALRDAAGEAWDRAIVRGRQYGYRNAQATLLAPTGTIGFLMDCDTTGVEPDYSLVKEKKLAGGGKMNLVNQSIEPALEHMGYAPPQRKLIVDHVNAQWKIEGAPGLRDEHLTVFDCAAKCGDGVRYIEPMGHIRMMEAVQPFLSGAISKTINCPEATTVEQIEALFVEGWKRGLKALAIFREGSKGCQVLTSSKDVTPVPAKHGRERLPKKRRGFTQEAKVGGQKVYVRTGEYPDGRLGEIFIDMHKEGATMRSMANSFAIAVSLGLQHGVPLEEYVNAFVFSNFAPNGVVSDHPNIKHASSIIDYLFRMLSFEYQGRTDLVQIKPDGSPAHEVVIPLAPSRDREAVARSAADARVCSSCGMLATRKGSTCYSCDNCGTQTGCA